MKMILRKRWLSLMLVAVSMTTPAWADDAGVHKSAGLSVQSGEQVYRHICQGCHMPDGKGAVGAGHYPAFAGNPTMASSSYMALTILGGRRNMPAFAATKGQGGFMERSSLSDAQIAAVINFIRTHFGNQYKDAITAAEVTALHAQIPPR